MHFTSGLAQQDDSSTISRGCNLQDGTIYEMFSLQQTMLQGVHSPIIVSVLHDMLLDNGNEHNASFTVSSMV